MDWVNEKVEQLLAWVRNLSFRKAMIAYILLLSVVVFGMSYITMSLCWHWETMIWTGVDATENLGEVIADNGMSWFRNYDFLMNSDGLALRTLDTFRVWCPFIYAFVGMIVTICIFYQKRLRRPLFILQDSMEKIRRNDLDFQIRYESKDEMGQLCNSFEEMRRELLLGKEEMWKLIERQKELNAAFAHDLRTPLTVLKGYTDFLARYIPEGKVSQEKMLDTLALMSDHLRRLEEYSYTMKGVRSLEEVPFAPEQMGLKSLRRRISEVVFALNQIGDVLIQYTGDEGESKEESEERLYWIDDNLVMEVLENVLSNAIRYARTRIEVSSDYHVEVGDLVLTIRDDGAGFSGEQLQKALKPYYKEYKGEASDEHFGIGLHISRELCKKHGGTLNIANSIRGGAVVTASFFLSQESRDS